MILADVVVHDRAIELRLKRLATRAMLVGNVSPAGCAVSTTRPKDDLVSLSIEAAMKRCGREMRMILEGSNHPQPNQAVAALIKAVARAHEWRGRLVQGRAKDRRALGAHSGLEARYVGQIMRCGFLAPDIVEMVLEGRQPPGLSLAKLTSGLPLDWAEQRRQLGFR